MNSGYVPLFGSLTTGTLCGRWPDIGLWPIILSLSDRHGVVDATAQFISNITGLPVDDVVACMARFCQPDLGSRSQEENGARLKLLDPRRDWGWQIINHASYREKARKQSSEAERVASGRNKTRMEERRKTRADPRRPALTGDDRPSDSDSDSDSEKDLGGSAKAPPKNPKPSRKPKARGTEVDSNFQPDEELQLFATSRLPDVDIGATREAFVAHHTSKGTESLDWKASWRTWVLKAKNFGYPRRRGDAKNGKNPYAGAI